MSNTKVTSQWLAATYDYIEKTLPNRIYNASNTVTGLMMQNAKKVFHGGLDSKYPFIAGKLNATNVYDAMHSGSIDDDAPVDSDLVDAAHQEGWGFWSLSTALSPKTIAVNAGSWAAKERIVNLALQKEDALINAIGELYEYNIVLGDGTNNLILGFPEVFDVTNTNYCGLDLTSPQFAPKNITIVGSEANLDFDTMISVFTDIEENGQEADAIVMHPNGLKQLRILSEATVIRDQGKNTVIGSSVIEVLGAKILTSRMMPTGSGFKAYFLNFGNAMKLGIGGNDKRKIPEGDYWLLEFAAPAPLGFEVTDWVPRYDKLHPTTQKKAGGAFKMYCAKTEAQAYISVE